MSDVSPVWETNPAEEAAVGASRHHGVRQRPFDGFPQTDDVQLDVEPRSRGSGADQLPGFRAGSGCSFVSAAAQRFLARPTSAVGMQFDVGGSTQQAAW